jgi:hypothetical protein
MTVPRIAAIFSVLAGMLFAAEAFSEQPDYPEYELQLVTARPGKLDELHDWFRAHQDDVLAKHGATNMAFLVPAGDNPDNKILCLYKFPNLPAMVAFSRALKADPLWKSLDTAASNPEGLVEQVDSMALRPTGYSPDFTPGKSAVPRVFELRTYTCPSPEHLARLHERFSNHTMKLFEKHGMDTLVYWVPKGIDAAERKLVYLLGHRSIESAKESFAGFRKDPDWLAAKEASEEQAGGSLTEKDKGVVSEFFVGTDYSPLR